MTLDEIKTARYNIMTSFNGQPPDWFVGIQVNKLFEDYSVTIEVIDNNSIATAQQYLTDNNITIQCDFSVANG